MLSLFAIPSSFNTSETGTLEKPDRKFFSPGISKPCPIHDQHWLARSQFTVNTFPPSLNLDPFRAALRTPRGLQLNLYPNGMPSALSGAGTPPQKEVNDTTRLFSERRRWSSEIAEQWSIPGSNPISFNNSTSESNALCHFVNTTAL